MDKINKIFDIVKNYYKLFQIDENELGVRLIKGINLISFISFVFLQYVAILFHVPIRDPLTILNEFECAYAQLIYNSDFSTDIFIASTGFLVAYYGVKDLKSWKNSHFGKVVLEIVKLFIKIWPFVILIFLFYLIKVHNSFLVLLRSVLNFQVMNVLFHYMFSQLVVTYTPIVDFYF